METQSRLANYDIILAIDKSGSMDDAAGASYGTLTRWQVAQESTKALARKAITFDADGITVSLFSGSDVKTIDNVKDAAEIDRIFTENSPGSTTPTDKVLAKHLDAYFAAKAAGSNPKPIIIAIITDGAPNDRAAVKKVIVDATNKMDKDEEIAISFLQVGNDAGATSFLQELDDELVSKMGAKFDIVDTKVLDAVENIPAMLEAALDD